MRIAGTEFSLRNKSFEIYVQGCYRHCPGCHNPETQPFDGGTKIDVVPWLSKQVVKVNKFDNLVKRIFITGGDLLCLDPRDAEDFIKSVKNAWPNKELWLFTGATKDTLPFWIWDYFNAVKCGPYDENLKQKGFPASSNQVLIVNNDSIRDIKTLDFILEFKGGVEWI